MRIAIAGFMHESNTFSRNRTDRAAFEAASLKFGPAVIPEWRDAHHEMGGFIEGASRYDYELEPIVMAWATPAGPVTDDVLDEVVDHIVRQLGPRIRTRTSPKADQAVAGDIDLARNEIDGALLGIGIDRQRGTGRERHVGEQCLPEGRDRRA